MAEKRKIRPGDQIQVSKTVSIDSSNRYLLEAGEVYSIEAVTPTGTVRVTKTFSTGEKKRAMISKTYYKPL